MQMESWRERGFVPDSDEEDGFDSQDAKGVDQAHSPGTSSVQTVAAKPASSDPVDTEQGEDAGRGGFEVVVPDKDAVAASVESVPVASVQNHSVESLSRDGQIEEATGDGHADPREVDLEGPVGDDAGSVREEESQIRSRSSETPRAAGNDDVSSTLSTPRAKQRDIWDIPSSSPDLLQLDHRPWWKRTSLSPKAKDDSPSPQPPQNESVQSSPLSSPPSSLHPLPLTMELENQQQPEEPSNQTPEDLLPPLDVTEDVLQELAQPTRRSLRQRNPIQLHPYLLEDAKYQSLMRARGLKPVRVIHYEQQPRPAANESQSQESDHGEAGSTSDTQMMDLPFNPSSPIDPRELFGLDLPTDSLREENSEESQQPAPATHRTGPRSPKRRRVIGPEDTGLRRHLQPPRPQVVIDNSSPPRPPRSPRLPNATNTATFDIPSPPLSGRVSSPITQQPTGFRFPRGFSPPIITPRTETRKGTKDVNDTLTARDDPASGILQESDDARSVRSASPLNDTNSDVSEEDDEHEEEEIVRRFQRKIKGVLPASWLRLDQQKQREEQERQREMQRNRERKSRVEIENARGVARRITRRVGSSAPSSAREQLSSLRQLAEDDSQENGEDSDAADGVGSRQRLADLFGFESPIVDRDPDGDIPEDNRIDYMFPSIPRNPNFSQGRKRVKKRRGPETDEARTGGQSKRPRLKRQARLTDPVYGGQRRKQPSQSLPRLGILDAPDIASRPRNEQPQFLRVAARNARSRPDRGRQSPSRKIITLSSRRDTEDANTSLREWRDGRLRQTTLPNMPSQTPRRQPLMDLSTNKDVSINQRAKRTSENDRTGPRQAASSSENNAGNASVPGVPSADATPNPRTARVNPVRQLRGNAWVIQRNLGISSLSRDNPRPVVPEIVSHYNSTGPSSSFQRSLALLNRQRHGNLLLDRFISRDPVAEKSPQAAVELGRSKDNVPKPAVEARRRQLKKRPPKRLDITSAEDHTALTSFFPDVEPSEPQGGSQPPPNRTSGGLTGFKTTYSLDFNVTPLQPGVFFHESTFVGSGEFSRALDVTKRDLDNNAGLFNVRIGDTRLRWGPWNDTVSSELGVAFEEILGAGETDGADGDQEEATPNTCNSGCTLYRALIKYISEALSFIDPVDRLGFVTRANDIVSKLMEELSNVISARRRDMERLIRIASYNVVFANQVCQIACHNLVDQGARDEAFNLAKSACRQVISLTSNPTGQAGVRKFLAASKSQEWREAGVKDDYPAVEAYIIVQHVLRSADRFVGYFEELVAEAYSLSDAETSNEKDIGCLETGWQRLFTILPLQEIDVFGIVQIGSRFKGGHDNWTVVKRLLRPVLDSGEATSETQPVSYYSYCRVLFHRCFALINGWGWRDCKPILDTLYDFFAERTLYNLKLEESYRSPSFLDELEGNPSFEVMPGDPCFHILLKIIGSGLRFLAKTYDKKKIRNYAYRLLPNHGRVYPKEQPIHQADLDALRNHHDLLCTLYSSVPDGCRPRLETIKNLVHPASSHQETCNISLRSWARLVRFKLSTNEDVSGLEPFAEWHSYFVTELLKQHSFARKEIEAQNNAGKQFSQQLIERTIARNQRQVESLLKTALQGLQNAVKSAPTLEHARKIVSELPIKSILGLFSPKVPRLNATVSEALRVIMLYVQKCNAFAAAGSSQTRVESVPTTTDEDSQEYGDWTDIAAVYGYETPAVPPGVEHVEKVFHPAVSRLVSNCFGEDHCPEDLILLGVLDCWTSIAQTLVRHGLRRWDGYLSPYDGDSWEALRCTTQTRKFTPQFLASCIEKDSLFVSECRVQILGKWLSSLVERVSMLKFQHRLTEALLNQDAADPVLQNLPCSRDSREGRYVISFEDLCQRRLTLISSLLSNMRAHIQELDDVEGPELSSTRQEYRELLQEMMSSMKANYQELGSGAASGKGAYVDFVHRIVGFLQQHTRDICPVDPFFTDPAKFPPPSADPTYIVARLKSYEPKLSSEKVVKTLIIFVQGISERAALDGQQTYLVKQLHASMAETYEAGIAGQPTLRATLLQCVFPAYLEAAFNHDAAWILSRPIIETISLVFRDLLLNMDTTDLTCIRSILNIFNSTFESSLKSLRLIAEDTNMFKEPTVLITAIAFLEMISSALPAIDYIDRASEVQEASTIIAQLRSFQNFALLATSHLTSQDQHQQQPSPNLTIPTGTLAQTNMATHELQTYIKESWSCHQGKYYFTRRGGQPPQEVEIEPSVAVRLDRREVSETQAELVDAARTFLGALDKLDFFNDSEGCGFVSCSSGSVHAYTLLGMGLVDDEYDLYIRQY